MGEVMEFRRRVNDSPQVVARLIALEVGRRVARREARRRAHNALLWAAIIFFGLALLGAVVLGGLR